MSLYDGGGDIWLVPGDDSSSTPSSEAAASIGLMMMLTPALPDAPLLPFAPAPFRLTSLLPLPPPPMVVALVLTVKEAGR